MESWTLSLFRQTRQFLTPVSFLRYREFLINEPREATADLLCLRMRAPINRTLYLRKWGSDALTFDEVFVRRVYGPVVEHLRSCRTMIDLGANIGLASAYLSGHFRARCLCVEPNPDTFRILKMNFCRK